jgi:hypothetical protein
MDPDLKAQWQELDRARSSGTTGGVGVGVKSKIVVKSGTMQELTPLFSDRGLRLGMMDVISLY